MKIVFATSSFNGGGITSYAQEFIKHYSINNQLHIILGDDSYSPIVIPQVSIHRIDCSDLSIENALKFINLVNEEIVPDIIIASNALIMSIIAKYINNNIRIITISHSLKYYEADIAALSHKYIDNIIALSYYNKIYLEQRFNISEPDKIRVIYNFVKDKDLKLKIEDKKHSQLITIINPGGAHPSKSPEIIIPIIIELCKTDLNFQFYWLGNTKIQNSNRVPNCKYHDIKLLLPNDRRVILPGKISRDDAEVLLEKSNILLFPSCREGCSMSMLEAMRAGTIPIVADYNNANKELIRDKENGYIISRDDLSGFINRIKDIIQNNESYANTYDNVRLYFENNLNEGIWKAKMDSIIYNASSNHSLSRSKFNKYDYLKSRFILNYQIFLSKIQMFYDEDLKLIKQLNKY